MNSWIILCSENELKRGGIPLIAKLNQRYSIQMIYLDYMNFLRGMMCCLRLCYIRLSRCSKMFMEGKSRPRYVASGVKALNCHVRRVVATFFRFAKVIVDNNEASQTMTCLKANVLEDSPLRS